MPVWKKGEGAIRPKGDFVPFKNGDGAMALSTPSWRWLAKHVQYASIVVRWWAGSSSINGSWDEHHFGPSDVAKAKAKAREVAKQYGWGSYVRGIGRGYSSLSGGMDIITIYEFGSWSSEN